MPVLKRDMPTGIRIIVHIQINPNIQKKSIIGSFIKSQTNAERIAPVTLKPIQNKKHIKAKHKIIINLPSFLSKKYIGSM